MFAEMSYMEKRCWWEAIGMFVSGLNDSPELENNPFELAWEQLLEASEKDEPAEVAIWEPFENWPLADVIHQIENTAQSLIMMAQDILTDSSL